jgi:hypothetical protein
MKYGTPYIGFSSLITNIDGIIAAVAPSESPRLPSLLASATVAVPPGYGHGVSGADTFGPPSPIGHTSTDAEQDPEENLVISCHGRYV